LRISNCELRIEKKKQKKPARAALPASSAVQSAIRNPQSAIRN